MRTVDLLGRLGADPRPVDRDPGYPFAVGTWYAACVRCGRFAAISVDRDGSWQAACGCWGRPWSRHDDTDLILALVA